MIRIAMILTVIATCLCAASAQAHGTAHGLVQGLAHDQVPSQSRSQSPGWKRAESQSFVVYSQGGSDAALIRYVQQLEKFDYMLRYRNHLPLNVAPHNKLPIYLVADSAGLEAVNPHLDR
ncbi:hypothetical protein LTR94_027573, partial [Friedmanniomyces endolithicus]